jgi:hypothetical protein
MKLCKKPRADLSEQAIYLRKAYLNLLLDFTKILLLEHKKVGGEKP